MTFMTKIETAETDQGVVIEREDHGIEIEGVTGQEVVIDHGAEIGGVTDQEVVIDRGAEIGGVKDLLAEKREEDQEAVKENVIDQLAVKEDQEAEKGEEDRHRLMRIETTRKEDQDH